MSNMMYEDKNAKLNITLQEWVIACHRENVEVYNEKHWDMMKYSNTINRVKPTQKCTKTVMQRESMG